MEFSIVKQERFVRMKSSAMILCSVSYLDSSGRKGGGVIFVFPLLELDSAPKALNHPNMGNFIYPLQVKYFLELIILYIHI